MNQMDSKAAYYRDLFGSEPGVIGLLLIPSPYTGLSGEAEQLMLVIHDEPNWLGEPEQWLLGDSRIVVRRATPDMLEQWVLNGDRSGVKSLIQGEVLLDRTGFLGQLRNRLEKWPTLLREQKLLCEFSRFILAYMSAKRDMQNGQILDAYSHVLSSLHYWAHVALVEQGMLPELTVWEQMRSVNPGIYKLFEELTTSPETLEQRVQLVVLACEFSLQTKMQTSCALLIQLLGSRNEPWSVAELRQNSKLRGLPLDLPLLLRKLVQRGLAKEVVSQVAEPAALKRELRYALGEVRG